VKQDLNKLNQSELRTLARENLVPAGILTAGQVRGTESLAGGQRYATVSDLRNALADFYEGAVIGGHFDAAASANRAALRGVDPEPTAAKPELPKPTAPAGDIAGALKTIQDAIATGGTSAETEAELASIREVVGETAKRITTTEGNVNAITRKVDALTPLVDLLTAAPATLTGKPAARAKLAASAASSAGCPITAQLVKTYGIAGQRALGKRALAAFGPPSCGKSYAVRKFAQANGYDHYLEHGCTDNMTELATCKGQAKPDGKGGWLIVDGIVSDAVRKAASGETVLLFLDEFPRLSPVVHEWLLTFLTGGVTSGTYRVTTECPDPTGRALEVLECPAENLHIVFAGNLEARPMPAATWSRIRPVRFEFNKAHVEHIAASMLTERGITDGGQLPKAFAEVVDDSRHQVNNAAAAYPVTMRDFEDAAELAANNGQGGKAVANELSEMLRDVVGCWNPDLQGAHTGEMDKTVRKWGDRLKAAVNK